MARRLRGEDYDEEAELRAIAPALVATWKLVSRVGTPRPDALLDGLQDGSMWLEIDYAPTAPMQWNDYFQEKLPDLGLGDSFASDSLSNVASFSVEASPETESSVNRQETLPVTRRIRSRRIRQ
jgi:hypothetical protein